VNNRPRFVLILEALDSAVPVVVRLRHVLKVAWRADRLRCVSIERAAPGPPPPGPRLPHGPNANGAS
jgi:hypothetical protein